MKELIFVMVITSGLGLTSCGSLSKSRMANLHSIQTGQSRHQVISVIGKPKEQIVQGNIELWHYELFSDDSSRTYPYTAKFENNVLMSFDSDYSRDAEDRKLRGQRNSSNQTLFEFVRNGKNGAPPLQGTGVKEKKVVQDLE
jgi:hypothetical protein